MIDNIEICPNKNINTNDTHAINWIKLAIIEGLNLSDNFPAKPVPIHMPAPARIIRIDTNGGLMPDKFTNNGFI